VSLYSSVIFLCRCIAASSSCVVVLFHSLECLQFELLGYLVTQSASLSLENRFHPKSKCGKKPVDLKVKTEDVDRLTCHVPALNACSCASNTRPRNCIFTHSEVHAGLARDRNTNLGALPSEHCETIAKISEKVLSCLYS